MMSRQLAPSEPRGEKRRKRAAEFCEDPSLIARLEGNRIIYQNESTMVGRQSIPVAIFAAHWSLLYCSAFRATSGAHAAYRRHAVGDRHLLQKLHLYRGNGDYQTRTGFDMWDSPHVAGGNPAIGGPTNNPGPMLWQYAYHANWSEVLSRVRQKPEEAKYIRDNGWTTLHLLVAGNANPVPLEVVRAVYDAFPAALDMRTNDYNRTPREIAERWKQQQDVIDFLSNPDDVVIESTSTPVTDDTAPTHATQIPPIMARDNRQSKPLTADAIVITSLQSQHNDFLNNQMSELKQINEDLAQTLHADIHKISTLEAENIQLKESGTQTSRQLEEALQRMKDMEKSLKQKHQNEVERRIADVKAKLEADADRRIREIQSTMQTEADRKINEVQASKSSAASTSNDADIAAMEQKLQTTNAELLSLKEQLRTAKIIEEQMRSAVVIANTEVESLVQEKDEALKAAQGIKAEIASAKIKAEEAQRRFVLLDEQAKEARNKLSVDIESLKKQYEARLSHLKKELRRLEEEKEENRCSALASNDKVRTIQKRLNVLEERAKDDAAQISSLKDAVEASKASKEQMRKAVESANAEFKEALKRWEGLESQVGNLAASERSLLAQVERLRLQLKEKQM